MYNLEKLLRDDNFMPFQRTSLVRPGPRPALRCSFPLNGNQESIEVWKKNKIPWKKSINTLEAKKGRQYTH